LGTLNRGNGDIAVLWYTGVESVPELSKFKQPDFTACFNSDNYTRDSFSNSSG